MKSVLNHLKKLDWLLIGAVAVLFLIGLITLYADSADRTSFYKQVLFGAIALLIILGASRLDYRLFRDYPVFLIGLYLAGVLSLILLLVAGTRIRGVAGWFQVGEFALQPVEAVKVVVVLALAKYFSKRHIELYRLRHLFISGLYAFLPVMLVVAQPDLGSALVIAASWAGLTVLSGIQARQFILLLAAGLVLAGLVWNFGLAAYQQERVTDFLNPGDDPLGGGYQTRQALIALGSGGLFGKGVGEGTQSRLGVLPEYKSDFIFAAIGEEWGLAGLFIVLAMWGVVFWRLWAVMESATNNFARLLAGGVFIIFAAHVLINIGTNLALAPVTGLPLPFVSAGGSNLLSFAFALGLVLSVRTRSFLSRKILEER